MSTSGPWEHREDRKGGRCRGVWYVADQKSSLLLGRGSGSRACRLYSCRLVTIMFMAQHLGSVMSGGASWHNEWHVISRLASTVVYLAVEGEDAVAALGLEDVGRAAEDAYVGVVEESAAVCGQEHLCERRRRRGRGRVRIRG